MSISRTHESLRLLPSAPVVAAVPTLVHAYDDRLRRPGELHELLPLPPVALPALERAAAAAGVPSGTAARLLIEAALVRAELAAVGRAGVEPWLDEAASAAVVCRRLSAAESDYLRGLRRRGTSAVTVTTVPVRLISKVAEIDLESALGDDLEQALEWETAALLSGRTMLEWALITVIAAG